MVKLVKRFKIHKRCSEVTTSAFYNVGHTLVNQYRYLPRVIKATNDNFVNFIWICFAECVRKSYVDVATSHDVKLQLISSRYQPHSVIVIPLGCVYRIHGLCHFKTKAKSKGIIFYCTIAIVRLLMCSI